MNIFHKHNFKESIEEAEIVVFWDEMAKNLPKSLERNALGDEKIFLAFKATYPKIKTHLITTIISEYEEMLVDIRNLVKPICRCMCEKNKIAISYNNSLYEAREIIESKIQQWKQLLNNK